MRAEVALGFLGAALGLIVYYLTVGVRRDVEEYFKRRKDYALLELTLFGPLVGWDPKRIPYLLVILDRYVGPAWYAGVFSLLFLLLFRSPK
jgi:hypothetical protein